jgi:CHAT domain-containing protein/predicted negative regulator of RcsB-dependent stress response
MNPYQAAGSIADYLGRSAASPDELLEDLDDHPEASPRIVVIDAVDEALDPRKLLTDLLLPLACQPGLRVVVGARRHVLPPATGTSLMIDLDSDHYRDPQALADYAHQLLVAAREPDMPSPYRDRDDGTALTVAAEIARKAMARPAATGRAESFLLVQLMARAVRGRPQVLDVTSAGWAETLPADVGAAFDEDLLRLHKREPAVRALLTALAWAKGPGLPWERIWVPVAQTVAAHTETGTPRLDDNHVRWLLDNAGAYIVEDVGPGQRSVYRPFHDLLAAHLRDEPHTSQDHSDPAAGGARRQRSARTEQRITSALLATAPAGRGDRPDWPNAHPYLLTYLAEHAAAAGPEAFSALMNDADFLAAADRASLLTATARLQQQQSQATQELVVLASAGARPPDEAYEEFLAAARQLLSATVAYEQRWPGSFSLEHTALPLIQQLSIYAGHLQADADRERAQRCRDEADELTSRYLGPVAAATVARDRAKDAAVAGRFHEALITLDEVQATFAGAGETLATAQTALQLANVYEQLGDFERALAVLRSVHDEFSEALLATPPTTSTVASAFDRQIAAIAQGQASREGEDALARQLIFYEIIQAEGRINRFLGRYEEAGRLLRQVRPYAASVGFLAAIDFEFAAIACACGRLDEADALLAQIEPDFTQRLFRPRRPALRLLQADVLLARDRPGDALERLDDGVRDLGTHPDLELAWKLQWRRGRALTALGRPADALRAYHLGAAAADDLRKAPLGHRLDTTYLRDKLPMFHTAIDLAVQRDDALAAAWFIELVKARALSATLSVPRADSGKSADEDRFDEISSHLNTLEFAAYAGTADTASLQHRAELLAQRDALLERIRIHDPRWRTMTQPAPLDVESLATRLGHSGRAALVLFYRPGHIVAAVLDGDGMAVGKCALQPDAEQIISAVVKNLRRGLPDPYLFDVSAETGLASTDIVPQAIIERAAAAPTLVVVPHGPLHLLPWSTMTLGGHRLFEQTAVGILPNLASLPLLDVEPAHDPGVLLLGDPSYAGLTRYRDLPQAGPELADIAALYGHRLLTAPRTREDATEAAFWDLARRADAGHAVLHIACDGVLDANEPLASGLLLTRSKVDAAKLITRRIATPEVILSASSAGWRPQEGHGQELTGDDALGLTASFLQAGARFVLVSVPPTIAEAARAFTVTWHRHRHAHATPLDAFRATQQEMLDAASDTLWPWAGITAYGCR